MKVIIITDALTAPLYVPRVRFLNNQLRAEGHSVIWYTERYKEIPEEVRPDNLVEVPYYHKHDRLLKGVMSVLLNHKNRHIFDHINPPFRPDIVFCSTFHNFGLLAAERLAERYKCALHIDLRDIAEQTPINAYSRAFLSDNFFYRRLSLKRRDEVLKRANLVTTVSKFHRGVLSEINANTHVIYNGYDAEVFYPTERDKTCSDCTTLLYTGKWYGERMQNPHPLFKALSGHKEIKVVFYTSPDVHPRLRQLADKYDINVELHSYVANSEVPKLLRKADFSLVLTSPENRGVLTTKFFEALGTETPILCTPSDEGELAELINNTEAGIATSDSEEILEFLKRRGEFFISRGGAEPAEFYSRQRQTAELIKLMEQCCRY